MRAAEAGRREVTVEDDKIEHAARVAWQTNADFGEHVGEMWRHQAPAVQEQWRAIAQAMLDYAEPSEEVKRLESQMRALRSAYEHAAAQRDKYMRRTAEWRDAAMNDAFRQRTDWLMSEVGWPHWRECDVEDCHICEGVKDIDKHMKALGDD